MAVPIFNDKQCNLFNNIRLNVAFLIDHCEFNCELAPERLEVLQVLEEFYKEMYQSHCDMLLKDGGGL